MPPFFLNIRNRTGYADDDEGIDLPDLAAARAQAIEGIRSMLAQEVRAGSLDLEGRIEIADAKGEVLEVVHYCEALQLHLNEDEA